MSKCQPFDLHDLRQITVGGIPNFDPHPADTRKESFRARLCRPFEAFIIPLEDDDFENLI